MGDSKCDKDTYSGLLKKFLVGDDIDATKLGGSTGNHFYLPYYTPEGAGTEKLLHMTYVF